MTWTRIETRALDLQSDHYTARLLSLLFINILMLFIWVNVDGNNEKQLLNRIRTKDFI